MAAATTAPMFAPELKIPVVSARSFLGNHSAVALMAAGKLPASLRPRNERATPKPNTDPASACAAAAIVHPTSEREYPIFVPYLSMNHPNQSNPTAYAAWNAVVM